MPQNAPPEDQDLVNRAKVYVTGYVQRHKEPRPPKGHHPGLRGRVDAAARTGKRLAIAGVLVGSFLFFGPGLLIMAGLGIGHMYFKRERKKEEVRRIAAVDARTYANIDARAQARQRGQDGPEQGAPTVPEPQVTTPEASQPVAPAQPTQPQPAQPGAPARARGGPQVQYYQGVLAMIEQAGTPDQAQATAQRALDHYRTVAGPQAKLLHAGLELIATLDDPSKAMVHLAARVAGRAGAPATPGGRMTPEVQYYQAALTMIDQARGPQEAQATAKAALMRFSSGGGPEGTAYREGLALISGMKSPTKRSVQLATALTKGDSLAVPAAPAAPRVRGQRMPGARQHAASGGLGAA